MEYTCEINPGAEMNLLRLVLFTQLRLHALVSVTVVSTICIGLYIGLNPARWPTPNGQTDQLNTKAPASVTSKGCSNNLRPVSESIRRAETI